jgi:hypothetical protein
MEISFAKMQLLKFKNNSARLLGSYSLAFFMIALRQPPVRRAGSNVVAWGDYTFRQANPPVALTNALALAVGQDPS